MNKVITRLGIILAVVILFYLTFSQTIKYYYNGFFSGIEDIVFYGQVIDQDGASVDGAKILIEGGGRYLGAGSGSGYLKTDENGRFNLKAKGGSLLIGPITHPNIDTYKYLGSNGRTAERLGFTGYQHTEGGNDPLWTDHLSETDAFQFKVWRIPESTDMSNVRSRSAGPLFNCNGEHITFDFTKPLTKTQSIDGDGQLKIYFKCADSRAARENSDWEVHIEAIDGGIQETTDFLLNEAPETGYAPIYSLHMNKNDPNYSVRVVKRFYYRANDSSYVGSLNAIIFLRGYKKPRISLKSKFNGDGSRYLYKADK